MFWDAMHIAPKGVGTGSREGSGKKSSNDAGREGNSKESSREGIVSIEPPIPYTPLPSNPSRLANYTTETNVDLSQPRRKQELIAFVNTYCRSQSRNITRISASFIDHMVELHAYNAILRDTSGALIGVILTIPLPIETTCTFPDSLPPPQVVDSIKDQLLANTSPTTIIHGYSTNMCVTPEERGQGLCMALIRGVIEVGFQRNMLTGYHVVLKQLTGSGVQIATWYRPLHVEKARAVGFQVPSFRQAGDRDNFRERLRWSNRMPAETTVSLVDTTNCNTSWQFYLHSSNGKKFRFRPNLSTWQKWTSAFPTYVVYGTKTKEPIGLFSFHTYEVEIGATSRIATVVIPVLFTLAPSSAPSSSDRQLTLRILMQSIIAQAALSKAEVINFNQIGDLTSVALESINAIKSVSTNWFELYNNNLQLKPEDICAPIV